MKQKDFTINCSEDGILNIECSIYRINALKKHLASMHNNMIVDLARQQMEENGNIKIIDIAKKLEIQSSSVISVLKDRVGYKRTPTLCQTD